MCTPVITLISENSPRQQADPKSACRYRHRLPQIYQGHIENIQRTSKETHTSTKNTTAALYLDCGNILFSQVSLYIWARQGKWLPYFAER